MATHSSILAWKIPWTEEPGGMQSMGMQTVEYNWVTNTLTFTCKITTLVGRDLNLSDPKSVFLTATGDRSLCPPEHKLTGRLTAGNEGCRKGQYLSKQHMQGLQCHVIHHILINIHKTQAQRLFWARTVGVLWAHVGVKFNRIIGHRNAGRTASFPSSRLSETWPDRYYLTGRGSAASF